MIMQQTLDSFTQYTNDIRTTVETRSPVCDAVDMHTRILENLPLVVYLAKRFAGKSELPLLDRIQEGNLGLIEAAKKYNPEIGPFSTYAASYITGYILRASSKESTLVSVSEVKRQHVRHIQKLQRTEEGITPVQIAERLGLSAPIVLELMNLHLEVLSLNKPALVDEEGTSLENILEADQDHYEPEAIVMNHVTHASLQHLLCLLSGDERKVIALRYGLLGEEECVTTAEIVRHFRKTKNDIERIEERAMLKLQKYAQIYHLRESAA